MSAGRPNKCTGRIAFVFGVIAAAISWELMLNVFSSISTNTGVAPTIRIAFAVAMKLKGVVITSSPGARPWASRTVCKAVVPLEVAIACWTPMNFANSCSNSSTFFPWASLPLSNTSRTALFSSSPRRGLAMGIIREDGKILVYKG